jgi:outer membrane protein assembly complex protein YaeT
MHKKIDSFKKKSSKWKKRIILGILFFLTIMIFGGFLAVHTSKFRTYMLSKIDQRLKRDFNLSLSAKSLDFNLFRLSASFEDLKIMSLAPENSILQSFVAQKLTVNLSAVTLFGKKVHIQKFYITDPKVQLSMTKRVPSATKKARPASNKPLSFRIDDFRLDNGKVDYQDRDYPITAFINDIAIDIHFQEDDASHQGILTAQAGEFKILESQFSLDKFLTELTFNDDSIQITRFLCETEPFVLDASGHIQDYQENPRYLFTIQGTLQMDFLNRISEIRQNFEGILSVTTSINGTGSDLTLDGHVQGKNILVADMPLKKLEGDFKGDRTRIALHNLEIEDSDGTLKGELDLSFLENGESTAEFQWTSIRLFTFKHWMPELTLLSSTGTSGYISAKWRERTLDSIDAEGEIRLESIQKALPASPEHFDIKGNISFHAKNGIIDVFPSSLHVNQTAFAVSGSLSPTKQFKLTYQLKSGDLEEAERLLTRMKRDLSLPGLTQLQPLHLSGQLLLEGEASGSFEQPKATLRVTGRDIILNTHEVGNVDAELTYAERTININSISIGGEQRGITMDGKIFIDPFEKSLMPSAQVRLKASDMDIAPFASLIQENYSIQGLLSGEAALSGKLTDPSVQFSTNLSNLSVNDEEFNSIDLSGHYRGQELTLERIHIVKDEGNLEGKLRLNLLARSFDVDIEGRGIDLSSFQTLNPEEKTISGIAQFQLKGSGTVENPVFSLQLSMENLGVQSVWVGALGLKAISDGRVVDIEMETPLGQTSVVAKLILEEPYLIQGHLKTESIDIWHTIRSGLEPLPSPIGSQVSADADFAIPLRDWKNSTLSLNLERSSFRYKDLTILSQLPIVVKIQNHELIIEQFSLKGPQTEFSVSGSLPLTEEHQGNINLNGSINLRILEALLPGTEASGLLDIEGSLSGALSQPVLNASVKMEKGQLASSFIPLNFHDISLKSEIKENILFLDHLSIGVGGGNISAKGQISLSSLFPGDLPDEDMTRMQAQNEIIVTLSELNLDKFAEILSNEPDIQLGGRVDGTVKFKGDFTSLSHLEVDGELTRLEFSLDEFKMSNEEKILFGMREGLLHLTKFRLSGGQSFLQAECELSLFPDAQIDARLSASLDSAVLSPLLVDAVLGGILSFDLHVQGDLTSPVVSGIGKISDGFYQMEDPPLLATDFNGTLEFPDTETVLLSLGGIVNGGSTNIQGKILYRSFAIASTRFELKADKVQLNYPEGFQAILDGTLFLEKREKEWSLGGDVKIIQSYYNTDIYPGGQLINTLRTRRRALRNDIPPRIRPLNLDIDLSTVDAFIIENNLVDLELDANIRVSGTVFDPRLSGFVRSRQTGQIVFGNHEYEVEKANLDFQDNDPLEGELSITGHTQISRSQLRNALEDLKVTLTITGTITNLAFGLSSSPAYPEIELASLLITGYGTDRFRDDAVGVIGDQLMLYFLSPFASPFTNTVKNFLKAEEISIEPINIASEEDPGARFTFRKRLIQTLDLIYSTDISNTQNQTWILDYNFSKNFFLQSFAKDDGSYGGSFSHRLFLGSPGGGKNALVPSRFKQFQIKDILFEGDLIFLKSDLSRMSRSLKKGSVFSYKELRKTTNALEAFYKANGYLNVVIKSLLQQENSDSITIVFNITPDSPVAIAFEGDPLSKKLEREVIDKWNGRLPEEMSVSQVKKQILRDLNGKGHLDASVSYTKNNTNGKSVYAFSASLGPKYRIRNFTTDGQSSISPKAIKAAVSGIPKAKGKGLWVLLSNFKRAKLRIEDFLAEYGYQNAVISRPQILFDRDKNVIDITLPIDQGIQSHIFSIQITGNSVFTDFDLMNAMSLKEGGVFSPTYLATDTNRLYSFYRSQGFHDVKIGVRDLSGPDEASIDLLYTIQEGQIHTISSIEVRGNRRTPERVIRRELTFREGNILRTGDLITSQKNLYNLMIFRTVHIRRENNEGRRERPKILVEVQEDPRFAVSYGLRYNSEEKLEGFGQLDLINILGRGRNGLFFYRQNDRQKDFRFSLKDPYLFGKRFNTLYSFFYKEETFFDFKEELWGLSIQQQLQVTRHSTFSYLFRINNTHSYILDTDSPYPFDFTYFLPEFQIFWLRDTRTSLLNAKNGSFLSLSLTYSPEFLNTTLKYIGFFGQYSLYVPISSRFVWASNCRIGLADAFDQYLMPSSRRFFAGGANSVRGFERNTVGPYSPFLETYTGGEALFVMNQELRFPLYKWLEGVAFFDVGNVYENLGDFNPLDVRTSAGLGLRLNLPAIFLRMDYGINLVPREYEKKTVIYFSIGQAF